MVYVDLQKEKETEGNGSMTGKLSAGKSRRLLPGLCSVLGTIFLAIVIAAFLPVTVPKLFGYQVYEVISGSMEPEIPVGSAVYVKATEPEQISEGEIIAFWRRDSVITHRVVENHQTEGEFITKGDANIQEDMTPVPYGDLLGSVKLHIPVLGSIMAMLVGGTGKIYAAFLAVWGVILHIMAAILKMPGERKDGS